MAERYPVSSLCHHCQYSQQNLTKPPPFSQKKFHLGANFIKQMLANGKPFAAGSYCGLFYNMRASVKTLRDSGSTNDMTVLLHLGNRKR
jgi:hypothetical protein